MALAAAQHVRAPVHDEPQWSENAGCGLQGHRLVVQDSGCVVAPPAGVRIETLYLVDSAAAVTSPSGRGRGLNLRVPAGVHDGRGGRRRSRRGARLTHADTGGHGNEPVASLTPEARVAVTGAMIRSRWSPLCGVRIETRDKVRTNAAWCVAPPAGARVKP